MQKARPSAAKSSDNFEPQAKIPRITNPKSSSRQRHSANLLVLPTEMLQQIIGNINIWHFNRIRATSRRLRAVTDACVMHEFRKALHRSEIDFPCGYEHAVLSTIHQASDVYIRAGFGAIFCGSILAMMRSSYRNPFCPHISLINKFLRQFYDLVEQEIGDSNSQFSRLLYNITLMQFFHKFRKSSIWQSFEIHPNNWRIIIELKGAWMGKLWSSKDKTRNQPQKRSSLLVMLSEMLIADVTLSAFKKVLEYDSEMFVFGNDTRTRGRFPRTLFTFTVHGSKKICSLFRSCLEVVDGYLKFANSKWPRDEFVVNLDINCNEAMKWGCSKSQHMEFGPFKDNPAIGEPSEDLDEDKDTKCWAFENFANNKNQ